MKEESSSSYETESEEFIRLKIDQITKVKQEVNKICKLKKIKCKKLEEEEKLKQNQVRYYLQNTIEPTLILNNEENTLKSISILNNEKYNLKLNPEIGTNLFFSVDNNIQYIGKSEVFYSATTKDYKNSSKDGKYKRVKVKEEEPSKVISASIKKIKKKKRVKIDYSKTTTQIKFKKV